jgi:hypothetical protein
MEHKDALVEL